MANVCSSSSFSFSKAHKFLLSSYQSTLLYFDTAALRDNGRTVAVRGSKTFGKGLIQHMFPTPDGGALKLTVAEYLTPKLQHVTKVGNARYDPRSGAFVGGGILPDVYCPSEQGIPNNIGADYCVGKALDMLRTVEQRVKDNDRMNL